MENNEKKEVEFSYVMPMSRDDINLLAVMCVQCYPEIRKRQNPANLYAYYIPSKPEYLPIAQSIFNRNGIRPRVYNSKIIDPHGQDVLRVNYRFCSSHSKLVKIMESIKIRSDILWSPTLLLERNSLLKTIDSVQNQYQK